MLDWFRLQSEQFILCSGTDNGRRTNLPVIFDESFMHGLINIRVTRSLDLDHTVVGTADAYYLEVWLYKLLIMVTRYISKDGLRDGYIRLVLWNPD